MKCLWKEHDSKPVVNEWVSGNLARAIGLNWPEVRLCRLTDEAFEGLGADADDLNSRDAVALRWVRGLRPFAEFLASSAQQNPEDMWDGLMDDLAAMHPGNESALYGMAVFMNWILIRNDANDYSLQVAQDGSFLFLDASFHLGGNEWHKLRTEKQNRFIPAMGRSVYPIRPKGTGQGQYTIQFVDPTNCDAYVPWLDNVASLDHDFVGELLERIPESWNVSDDEQELIREVVTRSEFQDQFLGVLSGMGR